jgi:hypothetical protein
MAADWMVSYFSRCGVAILVVVEALVAGRSIAAFATGFMRSGSCKNEFGP